MIFYSIVVLYFLFTYTYILLLYLKLGFTDMVDKYERSAISQTCREVVKIKLKVKSLRANHSVPFALANFVCFNRKILNRRGRTSANYIFLCWDKVWNICQPKIHWCPALLNFVEMSILTGFVIITSTCVFKINKTHNSINQTDINH